MNFRQLSPFVGTSAGFLTGPTAGSLQIVLCNTASQRRNGVMVRVRPRESGTKSGFRPHQVKFKPEFKPYFGPNFELVLVRKRPNFFCANCNPNPNPSNHAKSQSNPGMNIAKTTGFRDFSGQPPNLRRPSKIKQSEI